MTNTRSMLFLLQVQCSWTGCPLGGGGFITPTATNVHGDSLCFLVVGHSLLQRLAVVVGGGGRRFVVGGGWRLALGGWQLVAVAGWRRLAAVGGGWRLAVGGPWGLSLTKQIWLLQDSPGTGKGTIDVPHMMS